MNLIEMFTMMAVLCLRNKHLLIQIYSCKNICHLKCMVKQKSFIKCIPVYSGDERNIWKSKKYRAQTCQIRMTGLNLTIAIEREPY